MTPPAPAEDCAKPAPFRGSEPFLRIAPPLSLPMRHFALAAVAFPAFAAGLWLGAGRLVDFGFDGRFALGLVHVLTLGWVAQTVLGAWTQMIPVHGETPLASVRASKAGWWLFVSGALGLILALWSGSDRYWAPAALLYAGVLVSLAALAATHRRAARRDWTWVHFSAAFFWLAALGLAGVLMAVDRHRSVVFRDPEGGLIAHVHMALAGFVTTAVFGAGYRLFPAVALHQARSKVEGRLAFFLLQGGTLGLTVDSLFLGRRLMPLWAGLLALAYLAYLAQLRSLARARPTPTPSTACLWLGLAGGAAWAALGVALAFGWLEDSVASRSAYVYCALVGFFTPVILSQIHKIAPFLVWLHVYSPRQWTPPVSVPKIEDLSSRALAWGECAGLLAAVPLGVLGLLTDSLLLVRAAGAALTGCAILYAVSTGQLLLHLARPDGRWSLPARAAPEP